MCMGRADNQLITTGHSREVKGSNTTTISHCRTQPLLMMAMNDFYSRWCDDTTNIPMGAMYLHARMFCTLFQMSSIPMGAMYLYMQERYVHSLI